MNYPELLIPAGNLEKLRTAVLYGADAVYVGVEGLSLRTGKAELGADELRIGVKEAHRNKVKVYAAVNIFARNDDFKYLGEKLAMLDDIGIDAIIVSDPGILRAAKKTYPKMAVHLSTQSNTTNIEAAKFWRDQGVDRIVPARELTLAEIREMTAAVSDIEFELFIHGAMCMAYSGRCYLSSYLTARSSNRGECTHPCRWAYFLVESKRPDEPLILAEDNRYSYILSSKDLCMIEYIPELLRTGAASYKIEGRMKSVHYIAVVTKTYRLAIDTAVSALKENSNYQTDPNWLEELNRISNRGYTTGFYFRDVGEKITESSRHFSYRKNYALAGTVLRFDKGKMMITVGVRDQVTDEDELEILMPAENRGIKLNPRQMMDSDGKYLSEAHNGYTVYFPVSREIPVGAVIRKKIEDIW